MINVETHSVVAGWQDAVLVCNRRGKKSPNILFQDLEIFPDYETQTLTHILQQSPKNLQEKNNFFPVQRCENISRWDERVGRVLTFQQEHGVRQWLHWLCLTSPSPTPVNMKKKKKKENQSSKKCCWLLTRMPVGSHRVEFESCIDYPNRAEQILHHQNHIQLQCLVRCSLLHKNTNRKTAFCSVKGNKYMYIHMQILHFSWNIFTNSL